MEKVNQELEICENCKYYSSTQYKDRGYCDLWRGYVSQDHECDDFENRDLES